MSTLPALRVASAIERAAERIYDRMTERACDYTETALGKVWEATRDDEWELAPQAEREAFQARYVAEILTRAAQIAAVYA